MDENKTVKGLPSHPSTPTATVPTAFSHLHSLPHTAPESPEHRFDHTAACSTRKRSWLPGPTAQGYTSPFRFCAQPHVTPSVMAQNPVKPSLPPTAPSPHFLIHGPLSPPKALPKSQLPWIPPHPCSKATVLCSLLSSWHILAP